MGLFYEGAKWFTHFQDSFHLLQFSRCVSQMSAYVLSLHEYHTLNTRRKKQRECRALKFKQYGWKMTTFSQNFFKM